MTEEEYVDSMKDSEIDQEVVYNQEDLYNEERIIDDLLWIIRNGSNRDLLSKVAIDDLLIAIGWHLTEHKSSEEPLKKLRGCTYWSKDAFNYEYTIVVENGTVKYIRNKDKNNKNLSDSNLRHEHVVPKRVFRSSIENAMNSHNVIDDEFKRTLKEALGNYFACVVTDKQAEKLDEYKDKMPSCENNDIFTIRNPWARYVVVNEKYLKKESTDMGLTDIWKIYWRRQGRGWAPIGIEEGKINDEGWKTTGVKQGDTKTT